MSGVEPNYATPDTYELRFRRPGAGARTALLGRADSEFTNDLQRITDIIVLSGSNLQNLNLPIDPNGIVYDAISARADPGRDGEPRHAGRRHAAAVGLLLRCEPAGPGHARRRLLQVRPELRGSRVPERRELSAAA